MKNILLVAGLFIGLLTPPAALCAQEALRYQGTVSDDTGNALSGVAIAVQERRTETRSGNDGTFAITATPGDVLVFSHDGFLTAYRYLSDDDSTYTVALQRSRLAAGDGDDVYIPFGVRKRREINGAISTLPGAQLPQLALSSLSNALTGQSAGLNVWQTGTLPGRDGATVILRNRASFAGSNTPLALVDGVVRDFADMDLAEIECISLLKDATALAWYGNRGANGALLVTTKRGSAERTRFSYDVQTGVQRPTQLAQSLDSYRYALLYNRALQNDGFSPLYSEETLQGYRSGSDPYRYPDNDFIGSFIGDQAWVQRHVLTASGGNQAVRYFTLFSLYDQNGLYQQTENPLYNANTGYNRYNLRVNLDVRVNKRLDVQLDMGGRMEDRREPGGGNANFLNSVFTLPANAFPIRNEDGSYGGSSLFRSNPLAQLNGEGYISEVTRVLLGTLNATHRLDFITQGLSANAFYTFDIQGRYIRGRSQTYEVYERTGDGTLVRYGNQTPLGYRTASFNDNNRINELWAGVDYRRSFGEHDVNGTVRYMQAIGFFAPRLDDKRQGVSARMSYSFRHRYYAEAVGSYSGSDSYMPGRQFGFFPAVSVGWVASEDLFAGSDWLDYLKLRASHGTVGNNQTGETDKFPYAYLFSPSLGGYPFGTSFAAQPGASERMLPNPWITWEKARKTDFGLDARLLGGGINLSLTYFNETRRDILTDPLYPSIIGIETFRINDGETRMNGLEAELGFAKQWSNLRVFGNGSYTYARNEITRINESAGVLAHQLQRGHNIGSVSGYDKLLLVSDGLFQSWEEIENSPIQRFSGAVAPGDIKYRDINDDGVIDHMDRVMTDYNDTPSGYYGLTLGAQYKGFDVSVFFQGVHGRTIQIQSLVMAGTSNTGFINAFSTEAWSPEDPGGRYPRLGIADRGNNTMPSDFWLRSGDYIRLKNAEIGYTLPGTVTSRVGIRSLRLFANGFNLATIKRHDLPIDPELPSAGYLSAYPYLSTITGGLNVKF